MYTLDTTAPVLKTHNIVYGCQTSIILVYIASMGCLSNHHLPGASPVTYGP
jgi:hypothetical protein